MDDLTRSLITEAVQNELAARLPQALKEALAPLEARVKALEEQEFLPVLTADASLTERLDALEAAVRDVPTVKHLDEHAAALTEAARLAEQTRDAQVQDTLNRIESNAGRTIAALNITGGQK